MVWLTFVLAAAAVASAVFAFMQAKAATDNRKESEVARNESRAARDEAVRLSIEANAAFTRQAEAQERANEIATAQLPVSKVVWTYKNVRGVKWILLNKGTLTARNAVMTDITEPAGFIRPELKEPRDVCPGDHLEFVAVSAGNGPTPMFRVTWKDDGSDEERSDDTKMIIRR